MTTHYDTLGVSKTATIDEIKKAFKVLASKNHPDRGGSTEKFQEINQAYQTLSDPDKRAEYDNPQPQFRSGPGPDINDMFAQMFGGRSPFGTQFNFRQQNVPQKNRDLQIEVHLNLEETLTEHTKTISVKGVSGARNNTEITIPRGIPDGGQIRYQGLGDNSNKSLPNGDLYVVYRFARHPTFIPDNSDLYYLTSISCFDAILGSSVNVTTIDKKEISVTIPPGTQHGTKFRLKDYGLYSVHHPGRGSLIINVNVEIPKIVDAEKLDRIKQLKDSL